MLLRFFVGQRFGVEQVLRDASGQPVQNASAGGTGRIDIRFARKHIQCGSGDAMGAQRFYQRILIDHGAARGIDR